jgi:hypothetical protein
MVFWVATRAGTDRADEVRGPDRPIREARTAAALEGHELSNRLFMDDFVRELAPAVVADHRAGRTPSMGWPAEMGDGPAIRDSIVSVLDQFDLTRLTTRDIAIGLHVVEYGTPSFSASGDRALVGTHDGVPYCVVVGSVSDLDARIEQFGDRAIPRNRFLSAARRRLAVPETALDLTHELRDDLLAGCTQVHRFGMPGAHVRAWLGRRVTGTLHGVLVRSAHSSQGRPMDARDLDVGTILNGGYFRASGSGVLRACRAGDLSECGRLFMAGLETPTAPTRGPHVSTLSPHGGVLLGYLENEFGPEAFEDFWSSDEPVEVAFRNAFGIPPADWVQGHAINGYGVLRAGPRPGVATLGTALLLILGALAVGTRSALRRVAG